MMERIDSHVHFEADGCFDEVAGFLREQNLRIINVSGHVNLPHHYNEQGEPIWRQAPRLQAYKAAAKEFPDRFAWTTGIAAPWGNLDDFAERVIAYLDEDFAAGAIGVKLYNSYGFELKNADGSWLMMDDPLLDPILDHIARCGKVLMIHCAEPKARWPEFLGKKIGLYRSVPTYPSVTEHMNYGHCDFPNHDGQMAARDHLLAKHPDLTVIGAHCGSMEHDVREIAKRLERYPNFYVDTSGRRSCLARQDPAAVREFMTAYADRILWGMDQGTYHKVLNENLSVSERDRIYRSNREGYQFERNLYEGRGYLQVNPGQWGEGLHLSDDILQKIYWDNALRVYPGLFGVSA